MDWHRHFGLFLTDFFEGTPFDVDPERDLSVKQQFIDVVVVRRTEGELNRELPDGFENFANHNLITFKSQTDVLNPWSLDELLGHYVNYRKQVSPSMHVSDLIAEDEIQLYAVCSRFPRDLHNAFPLDEIQTGVWQVQWGSRRIRIIVARALPEFPHNAMLHLFSAQEQRIQYAVRNFQKRSPETSSLIEQLLEQLDEEGVLVSTTAKELLKKMGEEYEQNYLNNLTAEDWQRIIQKVAQKLPQETLLQGLSPEARLKGLSPDEIREYLKKLEEEDDSSSAS